MLTRQLATLLRSGLPLEETLQAVAEQTEKPRVQRIILGVRSKVVEGHPLADGLRDFPQAFPEIYRATVSAGEQSGKLDSVLERLSDYTESRQVMGQQVSNALVYPIVLLVLSFAIVSFLLAYVVPQVVAVFESGHQELPIATAVLIGMSDLIRHYWFYALIVIAPAPGDSCAGSRHRRRACDSTGSCCGCRWWASSFAASIPPDFRAPSAF